MENKLEYSFDDEPVRKFCYDLDRKKIEVHFRGYYDLAKDMYIEKDCRWVLENWEDATVVVGDEPKRFDLNKYVGIFSLILYMKYNTDAELEMYIITLDNRYITLYFKNPQLSLK